MDSHYLIITPIKSVITGRMTTALSARWSCRTCGIENRTNITPANRELLMKEIESIICTNCGTKQNLTKEK